jgi:acyl-CoA synthetase (AMP-forming)/AMP-acid ligase II
VNSSAAPYSLDVEAYGPLRILRWVQRGPSFGAFVELATGRSWSSAEIADRVDTRVAQYRAAGIERGDRVFLHFGNCHEFFVEVLAVWQSGGCVVPIDTAFTPFEIATLSASARPRFSVWLEAPGPEVQAALAATGGVHLLDLSRIGSPGPKGGREAGGYHLDDDALILFTSGTTGDPKGVVHTHRSLAARWASLHDHLRLEAFERTLCVLPTHFGHGLICNSLFPWLAGCDLYIQPPFRADNLVTLGETIDEHKITFVSSVPAVWRLALRLARPPTGGSLRRVFVGSAPLTAMLWRSVQEWSGTSDGLNSYGITETGSWLAGTTVVNFEPEEGLVGVAWGGTLRVLRGAEPGTESLPDAQCEPAELGHIWVSTPALMRGYLERDDLTARVVSNGWFVTGDIGTFDERGRLYLRGREREEINKGGLKVYPSDIDAVIERFPATSDVCAFGFEDPLLGEEVGVAVVLSDDEPSTLVQLHEWTAIHVAKHQLPRRWYVVREIPRTSRGKLNRSAVAAHCSTQTPVSFAGLRDKPK